MRLFDTFLGTKSRQLNMQSNRQKKIKKPTAVIISTLLLGSIISSCSPSFSTHEPIKPEIDAIVCPQSYEVTLDFFDQLITRGNEPASTMSEPVTEPSFAEILTKNTVFKGAAGVYFKNNLYELYKEFFQDVKYLSSFESNPNLTELITLLKVEDSENHLRKEMIEKYKSKINVISKNMQSMGYTCPQDNVTKREPASEEPKAPSPINAAPTAREAVTGALVQSMRKVLAVTYQSCDILDKTPLTRFDKNIQGVREECCHESGRGLKRYISSLSQLVSTHPYIQQSYGNSCFDLKKKPLIYDFGGRPAFTRGSSGQLDFFKNWGGTNVLGYDCSALIYTVLMGAGFRLKENKMFIASDVVAAQSRQFLNPKALGWSCLNPVEFINETRDPLLAGDVASQNGHTFLIYRAGNDPYGIDRITDCKKIDFQKFDFDILQSSPSKDGVGVNVYLAKDYLLTNETMKRGFVEYAKNYCERVKNGVARKIKLDYFSLVRLSTKSSCRMPIVEFANESCVKECI